MGKLDSVTGMPEENKEEDFNENDARESVHEIVRFDTSLIEEEDAKLHSEAEKEINLKSAYPDATGPYTIERFNKERGFGFLKEPSSKDRIFFHISDYALREASDRRRRVAQANEIETKIEHNESVMSLSTKRGEKGLASKKWCFSEDAKRILAEKSAEFVAPKIEAMIKKEIVSQTRPEIFGEGRFTFTINTPYHTEETVLIKPVIKEGDGENFNAYYEVIFEDAVQKELPIKFPDTVKVTKDGLLLHSIDDLKELEREYTPLNSDSFVLKKNVEFSKEITRRDDSGYPLHLVNVYSLLLQDPSVTINAEKFLDAVSEEYQPGWYHDASQIVLGHPELKSVFGFRVNFTGLEILNEKERGQYADDIGNGIVLPFVETANKLRGGKNREIVEALMQKVMTPDFQQKLEGRIKEFMDKKYVSLVTTATQRLFTGGYHIPIETVSVPEKAPIIQIQKDSVINLVEKDRAEILWNEVDKEMRGRAAEKAEKNNEQYIKWVAQNQKTDREEYAKEKPSEIIADRYVIYQNKRRDVGTANRGYTSGFESDVTTILDLKTGSILYKENKTTHYGMIRYSSTLGGDGWRRGAQVSGERQGSWDTVEYVIADEKVEQERFAFDRNAAEQFLKKKEVIQKNIQKMRENGEVDAEFKQIISEIENRRNEEKTLMKQYCGESFEDIDSRFPEYLAEVKQNL